MALTADRNCHSALFVEGALVFFFHSKTRCINVSNLFSWSKTLHVSDGLSVHHQEFTTLRTVTGICQTDTATAC